MLKLRWRVKIKNLDTSQEIDIFVPAIGPEAARMAAVRIVYAYLDWKNARACDAKDVRHAGLPLNLSRIAPE